jgi:hypothetical protein
VRGVVFGCFLHGEGGGGAPPTRPERSQHGAPAVPIIRRIPRHVVNLVPALPVRHAQPATLVSSVYVPTPYLNLNRAVWNLYRVPGPAQDWQRADPVKITDFPQSARFLEDPHISRDGKQLLYSRGRTTGDIWILTRSK